MSQLQFLPNTALAAIGLNKAEIYTYAQLSKGTLVEISGKIDSAYSHNDFSSVSPPGMQKPKLFTPLAAAPYAQSNIPRRYVFYIDDNNLLRDVYWEAGSWHVGTLSAQNCICAPYSKLAAIKLLKDGIWNFISVYYQDTNLKGDINVVSLNHGNWAKGNPHLDDPPLFGTSIAVVPAEPGLETASDSKDAGRLPVIIFQYDTLGLGSSQDTGDYARWAISSAKSGLSSHASITAVDDSTNFWCFYTSDDNNVQRVRIDKFGKLTLPQVVGLDMAPIPASPLSAVIVREGTSEYILLFYLLHIADDNEPAEHTDIYASTLTRGLTDGADSWGVSSRVCLTG